MVCGICQTILFTMILMIHHNYLLSKERQIKEKDLKPQVLDLCQNTVQQKYQIPKNQFDSLFRIMKSIKAESVYKLQLVFAMDNVQSGQKDQRIFECLIQEDEGELKINRMKEITNNDTRFFAMLNPFSVGKKMIKLTQASPQLIPKQPKRFKPVSIPPQNRPQQQSPFRYNNQNYDKFVKWKTSNGNNQDSTEYQQFMDQMNLRKQDMEELKMQSIERYAVSEIEEFIKKQQRKNQQFLVSMENQEVESLQLKLKLGSFKNNGRSGTNLKNVLQIVENGHFDDKVPKEYYDNLLIHLDQITQHPLQNEIYERSSYKLSSLLNDQQYMTILQNNANNGQLKELKYDFTVEFVLEDTEPNQKYQDIIRYSILNNRIQRQQIQKVDSLDIITKDNQEASLNVQKNKDFLSVQDTDSINYLLKNCRNVKQLNVRRQYLYGLNDQLSLEVTQLAEIDKNDEYFEKYSSKVIKIVQNLKLNLFFNKAILDKIIEFIDSKFNYKIFKNEYQVAVKLNNLQQAGQMANQNQVLFKNKVTERMLTAVDDVQKLKDLIGFSEGVISVQQQKESKEIDIIDILFD